MTQEEFSELWERERPLREGRAKRFADWAATQDPKFTTDVWMVALEQREREREEQKEAQ